MTNDNSHRTKRLSPLWGLAAILLIPAALSAHPTVEGTDDLAPSLDPSPFADFEPLDGFEALPATVDLDSAEDVASPPDDAVLLRFDFDKPKSYEVRGGLRLLYDHRPDFSPLYQSGLHVEYRPIDEDTRRRLPRWPMQVLADEDDGIDDSHSLIQVDVAEAVGAFDAPDELTDTTQVHPVLREAALTLRVSERGAISDVQVHPPTNPLLRSNLEELIRHFAASHPPLPEDPVSLGDRWTDSISWSVTDDSAELEHSADLTYTFDGWAPCAGSLCAVIDIEKDTSATGVYYAGTLRTDSASTGKALGRMLFDVDGGRVVDAQWNLQARGATKNVNTQSQDPGPLPVRFQFGFGIEMDTAVTLH